MTALLEVCDLSVSFAGGVEVLRGVSFSLERGGSLAVVGESGAGKSTLAHSVVGLIGAPEARGSVRLNGAELVGAEAERLRSVRWSSVAIGLQGAPFNPVATVGAQLAEPLREQAGMSRAGARIHAREAAEEVLLDPAALDRFPHELSGGERRRAMLAMTLVLDPELLVLDEPAAGLDPVTKHELLERIAALATRRGLALLVISHDLPAAIGLAERTLVLYAGAAVETGAGDAVIQRPAHPYTWSLVQAYPVMSTTKDLRPIRGRSPDPRAVPAGCAFHPRCTQAETICRERRPLLEPSRERLVACHFGGVRELLGAADLHKSFRAGGRTVHAVQGITLTVAHGEALGVIGASGSGKSTLARLLAGHLAPDRGAVRLGDELVTTSSRAAARAVRRRVQLVQQDPWDALSPRLTVLEIVREPLAIDGDGDGGAQRRRVIGALASVGLPGADGFLGARVHELSGGELQRIALARALVAEPRVLVADEPTSMLDASEQARMLVVLRERQAELGLALVIVSHDLAVVRKVTDRIVILDAGRVVEEGPSERICADPRTPVGRRLVQAASRFPAVRAPGSDQGEPSSRG